MTDYSDNFYKFRTNVFWDCPVDKNTYFSKCSYKSLTDRFGKNDPASLRLVRDSVTHSLIDFSTRTVLYNLMFMSNSQLLKEMEFVLILIESNKQNEKYTLRKLASIYNCIYFVLIECQDTQMENGKKELKSDEIATHMEKHGLCPCAPTHTGNSSQHTHYRLVLHDMPPDFYRGQNERGTALPAPPPPLSTDTAQTTFLTMN